VIDLAIGVKILLICFPSNALYEAARKKALTEAAIRKAFRDTGLFPFNPKVVRRVFTNCSAASTRQEQRTA